jgi:hypothetical protein
MGRRIANFAVWEGWAKNSEGFSELMISRSEVRYPRVHHEPFAARFDHECACFARFAVQRGQHFPHRGSCYKSAVHAEELIAYSDVLKVKLNPHHFRCCFSVSHCIA